jgi:hypothetical protein
LSTRERSADDDVRRATQDGGTSPQGPDREEIQSKDDRNRELSGIAKRSRHVGAQEQRDRSGSNHCRHGKRIEQVLDGKCRQRRADGQAHANERRLRRLTNDWTERCDIAERIAGKDRGEGVGESKVVRRFDAPAPGLRACGKAQSSDGHDRGQTPTDLTKAGPDLRGSDMPDQPDEQRDSSRRGHGTGERQRPLLGRHALMILVNS